MTDEVELPWSKDQIDSDNIRAELLQLPDKELQDRLGKEVPSWARTQTLATLNGEDHNSGVIAAFAKLADAIACDWGGQPTSVNQGTRVRIEKGTTIVRASTRAELLNSLVNSIHTHRWSENEQAKRDIEKTRQDAQAAAELDKLKAELQAEIRGDNFWKGRGILENETERPTSGL